MVNRIIYILKTLHFNAKTLTTRSSLEIQTPVIIDHDCLPGSVKAVYSAYENRISIDASERNESESGRELLNHLTKSVCNYKKSSFITQKYEKPAAICDSRVVSVSFSHTRKAVAAVASGEWVVGIDMETADREVSEQLKKRMKHEQETLKFYDSYPIIQIWTLKEAALKAIGTGLRKPMNGVKLEAVSDTLFEVEFFNGKRAKICSFQKNGQWISICYISSKLSEHFLSKLYVPIH